MGVGEHNSSRLFFLPPMNKSGSDFYIHETPVHGVLADGDGGQPWGLWRHTSQEM